MGGVSMTTQALRESWPPRRVQESPSAREAFLYWFPRLACLVLVVLNVVTALSPGADARFLDLHIYHGSVRSMFAGVDPYTFSINTYPFTYPPFALLVLSPTWLPLGVIEAVWLVAGLAVVAYLATLVAAALPEPFRRERTATLWIASALLASGSVRAHLDFGQISLFVIVATFADAVGRPGRRWGGVAIGLCAAVKLTPLLFIPWLLIVGRGRDAARAAATFVLSTAFAWLVLPTDSAFYWGTAIRQTSRMGDLAASVNQSLHGLLLRSGLSGGTETVVWLTGACLLGAYTLLRARACYRAGLVAESAALVGCASLVMSPVTWSHHETWTVVVAALLIASGRRGDVIGGVAILLVATLPLSDLAAHMGFLHWPFDNSRALVAVAVCLLAFRGRAAQWGAGDEQLVRDTR
ncbi:MAG: alpha,2-mannosyltransferase, partial [Frankiaceae bacterium]|nr:alpha,2-mannosyltransferase [Frankiaceae bacterium]